MKKKQLPEYDIIETIRMIPNPELKQIEKAKEDIISISKKEVNTDGDI